MNAQDYLNEYSDNLAGIDVLNSNKQELIDSVLTPEIKEKLAEIDAEFAPKIDELNTRNQALIDTIKGEVLAAKETLSGKYHQAVYSPGKKSWDDNKLMGYAAAHPEIKEFRSIGKPSVAIKVRGK